MADEENAKDRKFRTLFDGDEIDGKRYPLDGAVTGIDAFTAEYLLKIGRIEEVGDDVFGTLEAPYGEDETAETRAKAARKAADKKRVADKGGKTDEETVDTARLEKAAKDHAGGVIPTDLIDASKPETDADRLIAKAELAKLAAKDGVEAKGTKTDIAVAIIEARAAKK